MTAKPASPSARIVFGFIANYLDNRDFVASYLQDRDPVLTIKDITIEGISRKSLGGLIAGLVKRGLVEVEKWDNGYIKHQFLHLTKEGKAYWETVRPATPGTVLVADLPPVCASCASEVVAAEGDKCPGCAEVEAERESLLSPSRCSKVRGTHKTNESCYKCAGIQEDEVGDKCVINDKVYQLDPGQTTLPFKGYGHHLNPELVEVMETSEEIQLLEKQLKETRDRGCSSDLDEGFLSIAAHQVMIEVLEAKIKLAKRGGRSWFIGLYQETGKRVRAKLIAGMYSLCWAYCDEYGNGTGKFIRHSEGGPRSNIFKEGLELRWELAKAKVINRGSGGGLCSVLSSRAVVVRDDMGWPEEAETPLVGNEVLASGAPVVTVGQALKAQGLDEGAIADVDAEARIAGGFHLVTSAHSGDRGRAYVYCGGQAILAATLVYMDSQGTWKTSVNKCYIVLDKGTLRMVESDLC